MQVRRALIALPLLVGLTVAPSVARGASAGVGVVPQGYQSDAAYANSFATNMVSNVFATTQRVSCYRPEVPYALNDGPADGYSGESPCAGAATTGEDTGASGPYATQRGSNPGYPASTPMLVKNHAESHLIIDPTNPLHLIGSSKWFASAEGYNHVLGFYESTDGGKSWPVQGHIPGYEGWTDNTDPVGAFDGFGNYYSFILAYQFFYDTDGGHDFQINQNLTPNPAEPAEIVAVAVRPHGASTAVDWRSTVNGQPDIIASYPMKGQEPDKQWIAIDDNPASPHYNTIYAMWVVFDGFNSKPFVATATALPDGSHTPWSAPQNLPTISATASDTYLLPHVDPAGTVWTTVSNFPSAQQRSTSQIAVDFSTDGGRTWQGPLAAVPPFTIAPFCCYANTNTRSGVTDSFAVGKTRSPQGAYPLYVAYEDFSTGTANILLTASFDGGATWSAPVQVNDNVTAAVDEFQPNLAVAPNGTVSVAFYDRRLACPSAGSADATAAGLALDTRNPNYAGSLPPYGAANYCVNASVQFYRADLTPVGHNIRLTSTTWDPELNSDLYSRGTNQARGFIGDYFGHVDGARSSYSSFVSTADDGTNPTHRQQQVIAIVKLPPAQGQ